MILDVRPLTEYSAGHISGSVSNTFRGAYPTWQGWLVPADATLLLVTVDAPIEQIIDESQLVGYERFAGWPVVWKPGPPAADRCTKCSCLMAGKPEKR